MDPDVVLRQLRQRAATTNHRAAPGGWAAEFQALDRWLSNDGFLPRDWESATRTDNQRVKADRRVREASDGGDRGTG